MQDTPVAKDTITTGALDSGGRKRPRQGGRPRPAEEAPPAPPAPTYHVRKATSGTLPTLKVADPQYLLTRLQAGQPAGVLVHGVRKSLRAGEDQFLVDVPASGTRNPSIHAIVAMGEPQALAGGVAGLTDDQRDALCKADVDALAGATDVAYRALTLVDVPDEPLGLTHVPPGDLYGAAVDLGNDVWTEVGVPWREALVAKAAAAGWEPEPGERLGDMALRELAYTGGLEKADVPRHLTAIARSGLSLPVRALEHFGLVAKGTTFLDYGCGRGDNVRALAAKGVQAVGFDPHYAPEVAKAEADVVNLGYVLNVIEEPKERDEVLKAAWALAKRVLAVAVRTDGDGQGGEPHGDGVLTSTGTFQKFYQPGELGEYMAKALSPAPVVQVAPGVVLAFRRAEDAEACEQAQAANVFKAAAGDESDSKAEDDATRRKRILAAMGADGVTTFDGKVKWIREHMKEVNDPEALAGWLVEGEGK